MNVLGAVILVAVLLLVVFALANWSVLIAPATLSFLLFQVEGPLGVILLAGMLVLLALFVLYALALRTRSLMESRRQMQELEAQRKLANDAEASRLKELRAAIEREFARLHDTFGGFDARLAQQDQALKRSLDEAANGLAALVGEVDDKIDRFGGVDAALGQREDAMKRSLDEAINGLAAMVGELDDKVDRALARMESAKGD
jgi:uncharacterized integral membrane protein